MASTHLTKEAGVVRAWRRHHGPYLCILNLPLHEAAAEVRPDDHALVIRDPEQQHHQHDCLQGSGQACHVRDLHLVRSALNACRQSVDWRGDYSRRRPCGWIDSPTSQAQRHQCGMGVAGVDSHAWPKTTQRLHGPKTGGRASAKSTARCVRGVRGSEVAGVRLTAAYMVRARMPSSTVNVSETTGRQDAVTPRTVSRTGVEEVGGRQPDRQASTARHDVLWLYAYAPFAAVSAIRHDTIMTRMAGGEVLSHRAWWAGPAPPSSSPH